MKIQAPLARSAPHHLLLIVPSEPGAGSEPSATTTVAGMPLLRRIVLAGVRAGLQPLLANDDVQGQSRAAEIPRIDLSATEAVAPRPRRIVLCPANVLPQAQWLRSLRDAAIEPERLYVDTSLVALVETGDPQRVLTATARCGSARELVETLSGSFERSGGAFDAEGRFRLAGPHDVGPAERWLLRSLVRQSEGFMSRHVERRISLALTRRLVTTRITPNAMTLVSVVIGLLGAPFFLSARPAWQFLGAIIFLAHSVVDGCDGELARLTFQESRCGAILDFWGDNVVHAAVFAGMAVGWARASQAAWPLWVGAAAIASAVVAAAVLARRGLGPQGPLAAADPAARVVEALSNRDFIYLVLLLSAVGKAWWFLALVAAGTPIFVLVALRAGRGPEPT